MNKTYSEQEDQIIKTEWEAGTRVIDIAAKLDRKPSSIKKRARRLNLEKRKLGKNMQTNKAVGEPYKRPPERLIAYGIPKPLIDLGTWECHFQIDEKIEFCGARTNKPYNYCEKHKNICYKSHT